MSCIRNLCCWVTSNGVGEDVELFVWLVGFGSFFPDVYVFIGDAAEVVDSGNSLDLIEINLFSMRKDGVVVGIDPKVLPEHRTLEDSVVIALGFNLNDAIQDEHVQLHPEILANIRKSKKRLYSI